MAADIYKYHYIIQPEVYQAEFLRMTDMSQVRGENPQETPSTDELHSNLQVSNREVWERRSNSESVS